MNPSPCSARLPGNQASHRNRAPGKSSYPHTHIHIPSPDHTPPPPLIPINDQNNFDKIKEEYYLRATKDLKLEITALREQRNKKIKKQAGNTM